MAASAIPRLFYLLIPNKKRGLNKRESCEDYSIIIGGRIEINAE